MIHIKHAATALSLIAVVSTASLASQVVKPIGGQNIIVGAPVKEGIRSTRLVAIPVKLSAVLKEFNTKAKIDPVGKAQPPLTEDELITALQSASMTRNPKLAPSQSYDTIQKIITTKALADGAYLQSVNRYRCLGPYLLSKNGGSDLFEFNVWSVRLVIPRFGGVSSFSIRERFMGYRIQEMEAQSKQTSQPTTGYADMHPIGAGASDFANRLGMMTRDYNGTTIVVGAQAKDQVEESRTLPVPTKLPDVVKAFNVKAQADGVGKSQPALTEKELRAAMQWAILSRSAQEKSTLPYNKMQTILKTGALTDGAYLKSMNRYDYRVRSLSIVAGFERRVFSVWTIVLVVPYDGIEQAFPIREQFISYRVLRTF